MSKKVVYENMQAKNILNRVKARSMPFEWSINPYRGCQHGCSFCYARATHVFLGVDADDTFQKHIFVKNNAPEALQAQLKTMRRRTPGQPPARVAIGTATDPYQQIEATAMITRQCLEVLAEFNIEATITTRSPLILRDIDLLQRLPAVSVNVSMNTVNTATWRNFEPFSPAPVKRLETVRALNDSGIRSGIFLAPILPFISDGEEEIISLIQQAVKSGCRFIMPSCLRLATGEVKVWFFKTLEQHYPDLIRKYGEWYHQSSSAPKHYRENLYARIENLKRECGLTEEKPARPIPPQSEMEKQPVQHQPVQLSFSF